MKSSFIRMLTVSLALVALLSLVACGSKGQGQAPASESKAPSEAASVGMPNPFIDCESAADAVGIAGFDVTFPESVPGYPNRHYQAIKGELAQAFYTNGDDKVLVRKGTGTDDISGDYNSYPQEKVVKIADVDVTEKGMDGLVYCAIWVRDGYSYAIDAQLGLEPDVIEELVASTR